MINDDPTERDRILALDRDHIIDELVQIEMELQRDRDEMIERDFMVEGTVPFCLLTTYELRETLYDMNGIAPELRMYQPDEAPDDRTKGLTIAGLIRGLLLIAHNNPELIFKVPLMEIHLGTITYSARAMQIIVGSYDRVSIVGPEEGKKRPETPKGHRRCKSCGESYRRNWAMYDTCAKCRKEGRSVP